MVEDRKRDWLSGFGRALKLLREAAGLTQGSLAARTGQTVRKSQISSYENDHARPSLESLGALLEALGADFAELQRALELVRDAGEGIPSRLAGAHQLRSEQRAGVGALEEDLPAFLVLDLRQATRHSDPDQMARAVRDYVDLSRAVLERVEREEATKSLPSEHSKRERNGG